MLALTLPVMNTRSAWVGTRLRNRWGTNLALAATLTLFACMGAGEAVTALRQLLR